MVMFVFLFSLCVLVLGSTAVLKQNYTDGIIFPLSVEHVHGSCVLNLQNGNNIVVWFRAEGERRDDDGQIEISVYDAGSQEWSAVQIAGKIHGLPSTNPTMFIAPHPQSEEEYLHLIWVAVQGNEWGGSILMHQYTRNFLLSDPSEFEWEGPFMISVKPANDYSEGNPTSYERHVYTGTQILRTEPLPELGNETFEQWQVPHCMTANPTAPPIYCSSWIQQWQDEIIGVHYDNTPIDITLPIEEAVYEADGLEENSYLPGHAGERVRRSVGWMPRAHPIILPPNSPIFPGRIILGLYSDFQELSMMGISDDGGFTWRPSTTPIVGFYAIQPTIVQRNDGSLVAYFRDNSPTSYAHVSTSNDGGESWSVAICEPQLIEAGAGLEVLRLRNGVWVAIINDLMSGRYQLSIYLSADEGLNWTRTFVVEYDPSQSSSYHYPSIFEDLYIDNLLHITYSYHLPDGKSIMYRTLQL